MTGKHSHKLCHFVVLCLFMLFFSSCDTVHQMQTTLFEWAGFSTKAKTDKKTAQTQKNTQSEPARQKTTKQKTSETAPPEQKNKTEIVVTKNEELEKEKKNKTSSIPFFQSRCPRRSTKTRGWCRSFY